LRLSPFRPSRNGRSKVAKSPAHLISLKQRAAARRALGTSEGLLIMKTRAAVAFEAKRPLEIVEVDLEGPRAGEVLIEIKATGVCHTDAYTLDGLDSEGIFPS